MPADVCGIQRQVRRFLWTEAAEEQCKVILCRPKRPIGDTKAVVNGPYPVEVWRQHSLTIADCNEAEVSIESRVVTAHVCINRRVHCGYRLDAEAAVARRVKGAGHGVVMNDIQAIQVSDSRDRPTHFYGVHDLGANLAESFGNSLRRNRDKPRVRRGSPRAENEDVVAARDKAISQIRNDRSRFRRNPLAEPRNMAARQEPLSVVRSSHHSLFGET